MRPQRLWKHEETAGTHVKAKLRFTSVTSVLVRVQEQANPWISFAKQSSSINELQIQQRTLSKAMSN